MCNFVYNLLCSKVNSTGDININCHFDFLKLYAYDCQHVPILMFVATIVLTYRRRHTKCWQSYFRFLGPWNLKISQKMAITKISLYFSYWVRSQQTVQSIASTLSSIYKRKKKRKKKTPKVIILIIIIITISLDISLIIVIFEEKKLFFNKCMWIQKIFFPFLNDVSSGFICHEVNKNHWRRLRR